MFNRQATVFISLSATQTLRGMNTKLQKFLTARAINLFNQLRMHKLKHVF